MSRFMRPMFHFEIVVLITCAVQGDSFSQSPLTALGRMSAFRAVGISRNAKVSSRCRKCSKFDCIAESRGFLVFTFV